MSSNKDKIPLSIILDWEDIIVAGLKRVWERSKSIVPPPKAQEEYIGVFLLAASEEMVEQLTESGDYEIWSNINGGKCSGLKGDEPLVMKK